MFDIKLFQLGVLGYASGHMFDQIMVEDGAGNVISWKDGTGVIEVRSPGQPPTAIHIPAIRLAAGPTQLGAVNQVPPPVTYNFSTGQPVSAGTGLAPPFPPTLTPVQIKCPACANMSDMPAFMDSIWATLDCGCRFREKTLLRLLEKKR